VTADQSHQWQYRSVARTDRGLVRPRNEDSVVNRPTVGIWAVADGMGGHNRGDRASHILQEELTRLQPEPAESQVDPDAMRGGISAAHERVRAELGGSGMSGTTVVALAIRGDRYTCMWAGDSRLYRCTDGEVELLTSDHSVVQELVDAGAITPEAAVRHPLRNRITRAVGVEPTLDLQVRHGEVHNGQRFLLSSDGLHGFVDAKALGRLAAIDDLDKAADAMVAAALDAGGKDNVSLVLIAADLRPTGGNHLPT
jgi:serine/threonine protein phosphatase PrpC